MNDGEEMINSACERIKELENELAEVKVAYEGMKAQRDNMRESFEDAVNWIEHHTKWSIDNSSDPMPSINYLEKILKEHLK